MDGYSLHVGVGQVDEEHYGEGYNLNSAENDARDFYNLVTKAKVFEQKHLLLGSENGENKATAKNFFDRLNQIIEATKKDEANGAYVLLTFSCHGAKFVEKEKSYQVNEFLCFHDRMVLEHEIKAELLRLPKWVKCFIVLDACFGEGLAGFSLKTRQGAFGHKAFATESIRDKTITSENIKVIPVDKVAKVIKEKPIRTLKNRLGSYGQLIAETPKVLNFRELQCEVCFLAACGENDVTFDGGSSTNSYFSSYLFTTWNNDAFVGNYNDMFKDLIAKYFDSKLQPVIYGSTKQYFLFHRPFLFNQKSINHKIYKS